MERIKSLIKEKGFSTLEDFARRLGMSRQALGKILQSPSYPSLIKIADALGVEMWELFADGREIAARYQEQGAPDALRCPHCGNECELHAIGSRIELRTPTPWKK